MTTTVQKAIASKIDLTRPVIVYGDEHTAHLLIKAVRLRSHDKLIFCIHPQQERATASHTVWLGKEYPFNDITKSGTICGVFSADMLKRVLAHAEEGTCFIVIPDGEIPANILPSNVEKNGDFLYIVK